MLTVETMPRQLAAPRRGSGSIHPAEVTWTPVGRRRYAHAKPPLLVKRCAPTLALAERFKLPCHGLGKGKHGVGRLGGGDLRLCEGIRPYGAFDAIYGAVDSVDD